jgi:hypothetical protein
MPVDHDKATFADAFASLAGRTGCLLWQARNGDLVFELPSWRASLAGSRRNGWPRLAASAVAADVTWRQSPADVVNDMTVAWNVHDVDGWRTREETVTDAASVAAHGRRHVGLESLWLSPAVAQRHANRIVERWRDALHDVSAVRVDSRRLSPADAATFAAWLNPSQPIILPLSPDMPASVVDDAWLIEGYREDISGDGYVWTLSLSPVARYGWRRATWQDWRAMTWQQLAARSWLQRLEARQ